MSELVADFVLSRLKEWGVHRIFGYPGDGINGFLGALDRAQGDGVRPGPPRGDGRVHGLRPREVHGRGGVCMATSGPVRSICSTASTTRSSTMRPCRDHRAAEADSLGAEYQQEVDLQMLFKDVSEYVQTCMEPAQARHLIDRAVRTALDRKGVTTLIFPNDVQEEKALTAPPREHGAVFSSVGYSPPRVIPHSGDLESRRSC